MTDEPMLTMSDLAQMAGIQRMTVAKYRHMGQNGLPDPDGFVMERGRPRPLWKPSTIRPWLNQRSTKRAEAVRSMTEQMT